MGQTVAKDTKCKDINIMKKTLQELFGWSKIETLTPEQEKQGKRLPVNLFGKVIGDLPVVLKVDKENLVDKQGRKAVWSDFAVVRKPDGTLQIQSDLHNFDPQDKICFVTEDMIKGVNNAYTKEAIDTHLQTVTTETVSDWSEDGENLIKVVEIDEEEIPNIPPANYL